VLLVARGLGSQIHLWEVRVFDEVVLMTHRTGGRYERVPPVPVSAKLTGTCPHVSLSARYMVKCLDDFYHVQIP
jgi:hypothetical protein